MAKYRYKRGDQPLDGYTIEYGLGVGGFGEVYFAVSDAGREVALKALQNYEEIELRGIRHCMNLKSPHLVSVFDVRHNSDQEPFVIMEYVQGPSLRQLLDASPEGIGPTKAAFFLREMAKGLTYLHEAGVVHRDLKPHNVFYEEGFVKIGDYSLCKLISTSHRTGHTMTVGTVHYMAPEISQGRYDAGVDVYALGIILYEMLTGLPPFTGDSLGEVLMKHMTAEPDLSKVEEPYRSTIAKALSKNPDDRFATSADMVESIFGEEHVQNSVVEFNPQELTMVAHMATKRVLTTPSGRPVSDRPGGGGEAWSGRQGADGSTADFDSTPRNQQSTDVPIAPDTLPFAPRQADGSPIQELARIERDQMPFLSRGITTIASLVVLAYLADLSSQTILHGAFAVPTAGTTIAGALAAMLGLAAVRRFRKPDPLLARLVVGAAVSLAIGVAGRASQFWDFNSSEQWVLLKALAVALPFFVLDWGRRTDKHRTRRIDGWALVGTATIAYAAAFVVTDQLWLPVFPILAAAISFGVALCVQLLFPFHAVQVAGSVPVQSTSAAAAMRREQTVWHATSSRDATSSQREYTKGTPPPVPDTPGAGTGHSGSAPIPSNAFGGSQDVLRLLAGGIGLALFAGSCVLAILAMSPMFNGHDLTVGTRFSLIGFGLTVPAFGLFVASGCWQGGAFGRMFAACMMLSWMHLSYLMGDLPEPVMAMMLPVAAALLAWPRSKKKTVETASSRDR